MVIGVSIPQDWVFGFELAMRWCIPISHPARNRMVFVMDNTMAILLRLATGMVMAI